MKSRTKLKNIVMIALAVILAAAIIFTSGIIRIGNEEMAKGAGGQPPQMQAAGSESGSDSEVTELSDSKDGDDSKDSEDADKPEPPENADGQEPPEKPDGEDMPDMEDADGQEPPEMSDGEDKPDMEKGEKPDGMQGGMGTMRFVLTGAEALLLSIIIMYLIMSAFNRKTFRETFPTAKKKIAYIVVTLLLGAAIFAAASFIPMKLMGAGGPGNPGQMPDGSKTEVTQLDDTDSDDTN